MAYKLLEDEWSMDLSPVLRRTWCPETPVAILVGMTRVLNK